ncbi:hypothetical protein SAMN05444392_11036 [Seinonella peptonophila]|uniref:Uncharacterized protein n=1 Tax=Seinonella peptonophila TaxID=112248 RepID=A0A1M4ZPV4_9BACL|nr:hypothetical protein [Seinonella peptonophila]SHF19847.1 hypothetical protein SAMN05444392_11036 [Seinonella peptonophila]
MKIELNRQAQISLSKQISTYVSSSSKRWICLFRSHLKRGMNSDQG